MNLPSIDFLATCAQRKINKVTEMDLSTRSEDGIQYASAVIYAEYLGITINGRIPLWVRRLRMYPLSAPDELLYGVRYILRIRGVELTDHGVLRKLPDVQE